MNNQIFAYKGYVGQLEIDTKENVIHGRILDINDVVTFVGETVEKARQEFEISVDEYLEFCQELGKIPDKPFSGKLPFRTTPEHHRLIHRAATIAGKSMNAWMDEVLVSEAEKQLNV